MSSKYKLLNSVDYAIDAVESINRAQKRVYLAATTLIDDDEFSAAFIAALKYAAVRGVEVSIAADAFTYTELRDFQIRSRNKTARQLSQEIVASGAKIHWMGRFSYVSMAGRTHSKWLIADDTVYSFGGMNLDRRSFTNLDYMLRTTDSELAERLAKEHQRMIKADKSHHIYRSHSFTIGQDKVLVDGGFVGESLIYRRACQLTQQATRVTLVSQYCPTGKLSRLLKKADSRLYFNHWSKADGLNKLLIRYGMIKSRHSSRYQRVPYLHAKFMIFEMPDNTKIALTGSHNFVYGGVLAGTREVALETTDKRVIKQLEGFLNQYVA